MSSQFLLDYLGRTRGDLQPVQRNQATIALLCWDLMSPSERNTVYNAFVTTANNLVYS